MSSNAIGRAVLKHGTVRSFLTSTAMVPVFMMAIAVAEVIGVYAGPSWAIVYHAILIPVLLGQYVLMEAVPYRRMLPILALAPLLRILSMTMPIRQVPLMYWYALVGLPLLVSVVMAARLLKLSPADLGLRMRSWPAQARIMLSALPLSLVGYLILRPKPIASEFSWQDAIVGTILLVVFSGFAEEILFRGLFLRIANETFGRSAVFVTVGMFAIMYIGSTSLSYLLFIILLGFLFNACVNRTGSIWGVALAHGLMNSLMLLFWPFMLLSFRYTDLVRFGSTTRLGLWILFAAWVGSLVATILLQFDRVMVARIRHARRSHQGVGVSGAHSVAGDLRLQRREEQLSSGETSYGLQLNASIGSINLPFTTGSNAMDQQPTTESAASESRSDVIRCSITEAGRRLRISPSSVRRRIKAGVLKAEKEGGRLLVLLPAEQQSAPAEVYAADTARDTWLMPADVEEAVRRAGGMLSGDTRAVSDELSRLVDAKLGRQSEAPLALSQRIVNVEREREALEARLRALEHSQEAGEQGSEAGEQGLWEQMFSTMDWKRWRFWVTEILIAVLIGFAIVGLGDYFVRGDDIPLLPDRQSAAPTTTRIPTSEAVTPHAAPPANGITGPSQSSSAKTPEPPPVSR